MAKYFYPLYMARPGEWPSHFTGNVPQTSGSSIAYIGPGVNGPSNSREFVKRGVSEEATSHTCLMGISAADVDILYRARLSPVPASSAFSNNGPICCVARASFSSGGATGRPTSCYYFTNGQSTTNSSTSNQRSVTLIKNVGGTLTQLGAVASNALANPSNWETAPAVLARLQCIGTTIRGRMWYENETEPETWHVSVTDTDLSSGDVGFIMHGYGQRCAASWLSVGTDADAAPSVPTRQVFGTVLTPTSTPAVGYRVNVHDQISGVLIGSQLTNASGEFDLSINYTGPIYAVAIDQVGNTWKAPIKDRIMPNTPL